MQRQSRLNPPEAVVTSSQNSLQDGLRELAAQNQHLQALVVELLDKNERLRHALAQHGEEIPA